MNLYYSICIQFLKSKILILNFQLAWKTDWNLYYSMDFWNESSSSFLPLFLTYIIVTKVNATALLADSVMTSLGESVAWIANWRLLTSIFYSFVSFILGIIFTVPNGWQMLLNTYKAVEIATILLLPFIVSIF